MRINVMGAAGWTIRSVRLNGADITDAGVEVRPGEDVAGVEVEMTNKVTTVSGLVTNARGETATDYSAIAFAQDRDKWKLLGRYEGMGRPDQDGRHQIAAIRRRPAAGGADGREPAARAAAAGRSPA